MKYSAAEKAIGNLNERRAFQVALLEALQIGVMPDDVKTHIAAMDLAIHEIRTVMPGTSASATPKKPRAARKAKKDTAQ